MPALFLTRDWESVDMDGRPCMDLCCLHRDFAHPQIWVSMGVLEPVPTQLKFQESKVICEFSTEQRVNGLPRHYSRVSILCTQSGVGLVSCQSNYGCLKSSFENVKHCLGS